MTWSDEALMLAVLAAEDQQEQGGDAVQQTIAALDAAVRVDGPMYRKVDPGQPIPWWFVEIGKDSA